MSPEQIADGNAVDARSDLWALGVIAFRCLTGREPFPGTQIGQVLLAGVLRAHPGFHPPSRRSWGPKSIGSSKSPSLARWSSAFSEPRTSPWHSKPLRTPWVPADHRPHPKLHRRCQHADFPTPVPQTTPLSHGGPVSATTGKPPNGGRVPEGPMALTESVSPMTHRPHVGSRRTGRVGLVLGFGGAVLVAGGFLLLRPFRHLASTRPEPSIASAPGVAGSDEPTPPVVASVTALPAPTASSSATAVS